MMDVSIKTTYYNKSALSFGAGKTTLMTDFDGTYLPEHSSDVYKKPSTPVNQSKIKNLKKYFASFDDFYKKARNMLEIVITTGRELIDFQKTSSVYSDLGINIPNPQKFIESGGGSIYKLENGEYKLENKKQPTKLEKAFDVKKQLKLAKENDDFIIAAGNEYNDKEMLNIFSYVELPKNTKIPVRKEDISPLLEQHPSVKKEIEELPLKIIFFKADNEHSKYNEAFYGEIHRVFPDKFETIEHKEGENVFLENIKTSIKTYSKNSKRFKDALAKDGSREYLNELSLVKNNKWLWLLATPVIVGSGILVNEVHDKKSSSYRRA